MLRSLSLLVLILGGTTAAGWAENLCFNGSFNNSNPLEGWTCDYQFVGNKNYMDNHKKVTARPSGGGRSTVVQVKSTSDAGAKIESKPIPFELGYRYTCRLKLKGGGNTRIYFAGYKWKPGIRPHEEPTIGELRTIYKSKALQTSKKGWQNVEIEIPGVKVTPLAYKHMKYVRFITVYIWTLGDILVDDVEVTRVTDRKLSQME
ncbi:MAG: hypothetical protein HN341_06390 [Verrucomicrobia bacterium]|jgi:hypothetical protein|nr:hypothetical protein [Verrucomicrobiota bacterium]